MVSIPFYNLKNTLLKYFVADRNGSEPSRPHKAQRKLGAAPHSSTTPSWTLDSFVLTRTRLVPCLFLKFIVFKGTLPDNLGKSSKLLYSKELGWFSQPQMGFSFFSIFCLTLRIFGSLQICSLLLARFLLVVFDICFCHVFPLVSLWLKLVCLF